MVKNTCLYRLNKIHILLFLNNSMAIFTYQAGTSPDEYMIVGVFGTVTALLHLANRADTRKYFRSKR